MSILIAVIVLAVVFDFINGFHDAANAIATVVSTRVLTPIKAVIWAALFNFMAFFIAKFIIGEFGIADTVSKTVIAEYVTLPIIFCGLIAAIIWNLFTWRLGLPSSSSHTLIGGFAGSAVAAVGFNAIHSGVIGLVALFIIVAPVMGMMGGLLSTAVTLWIARNTKPKKADSIFRKMQLLSSAMLSVGHGLNDSQKVMGIIAAALIAFTAEQAGAMRELPAWLTLYDIRQIHDWVPIACFTSIALGTLSGGWRIIKTMGSRITKLNPLEGFCAEISGGLTLFITEYFKAPVSTTHVIAGSIIGVGAFKRLSAVRWGITVNLIWAWIFTIPVSATLGMAVYFIFSLLSQSI